MMKVYFWLLITASMLTGFATTVQAQKISIPRPQGAFPIAVGDVPPGIINGAVQFVAYDSVRKSAIPAHVVLTSGKKKLEYMISTGLKSGAPDNPTLPFSPKDSVDIVVTSPGYRTIKEKIRIKPDQLVNIRMAPTGE